MRMNRSGVLPSSVEPPPPPSPAYWGVQVAAGLELDAIPSLWHCLWLRPPMPHLTFTTQTIEV